MQTMDSSSRIGTKEDCYALSFPHCENKKIRANGKLNLSSTPRFLTVELKIIPL